MSKTSAATARTNIKKAQAKASSPEARAKAVATFKARRAQKAQAEYEARIAAQNTSPTNAISLDMIPDPPKRSRGRPKKEAGPVGPTRQDVVLALLKYLNGE